MITFENTGLTGLNRAIAVKLDGRKVGFIRSVDGGFQYFPQSSPRLGGDVFQTLGACKDSLIDPYSAAK